MNHGIQHLESEMRRLHRERRQRLARIQVIEKDLAEQKQFLWMIEEDLKETQQALAQAKKGLPADAMT